MAIRETDAPARRLDLAVTCALDVRNTLGERRVFAALQPEWGGPDGAAVDADGCYWSCGISAGRLNRFSPTSELIEYVELPVTHPTMPCFAGTPVALYKG